MELRAFEYDGETLVWKYSHDPRIMIYFLTKYVIEIEAKRDNPEMDAIRVAGNVYKLAGAMMDNVIKNADIDYTINGIASIRGINIDPDGNIKKDN